ncbi:hypothetical protein [Caldilinea sp.]|uniref:hypothetical protein n=1 Tax=Caldilinea sp. TaxID=2293560 RepID=UPI002CD06944|nr:hypothetical protein [Anaerolineales bacterium]HQY93589.1 hypothetical protein [Caldilinea sp.]HRA64681.1 hypothetical protein [Caldilinea sp.]
MNQGLSPRTIATQWRGTLDLSLESGEAPVFTIDATASGLAGMNAVLALALLDAHRNDLAAPRLTVGGTSPLWLAALWHTRPPNAPLRTLPTVTAYTAPDVATHLAALTTWDTQRAAFHRRAHDLPPWAAPAVAPETNPAAGGRWETSPLARFSDAAGSDGWLAWAGVVMAVALLLIAALA